MLVIQINLLTAGTSYEAKLKSLPQKHNNHLLLSRVREMGRTHAYTNASDNLSEEVIRAQYMSSHDLLPLNVRSNFSVAVAEESNRPWNLLTIFPIRFE